MAGAAGPGSGSGAAGGDGDDSLYPIAVLIDELRNEDVQVLELAGERRRARSGARVGKGEGRRRAGRPGIQRAGLKQKLEGEEGEAP